MFPKRVRIWLSLCCLGQLALLYGLSVLRYENVHQRTFDLALYARLAWGLARLDFGTQVLHVAPLGTHLSPALVALGVLGRALPLVNLMLFTQALCVAACIFPIARIGARHMGKQGIVLAVAAWLLYPNVCHVATYEFHPGTLALLPICWAFDALDRGHVRHLSIACFFMLCCREDLGLMSAILALLAYARFGRREALWLAVGCVAYTACAVAIVVSHAPPGGSLNQHFGVWGGSPLGVVPALFSDPSRVLAHFGAPERLWYLPRLLALLSFFPLRAGRALLPALPYLVLNLLSEFPTAQQQSSHYLTASVPSLVVAGIVGVTAVRKRAIFVLWLLTLALGHYALGGSPVSRDFEQEAFVADASTHAARAVLSAIPGDASVHAPDPLLPHLAARRVLRREPPPLEELDYVALDISHRERYARHEDLLRTNEEPLIRALLARDDYGLLVHAPPYVLFKRGLSPREVRGARACLRDDAIAGDGVHLNGCLAVVDAAVAGQTLALTFRAARACPADMAVRFGDEAAPYRVELLCEGTLSPRHLKEGDLVRDHYVLNERELAAARAGTIWVGALLANGKTLHPNDPLAAPVQVRQAEAP